MSRKRDTNWSRDEITVLLDSIIEITRTRANDGKRTNSREVFEYAAKKMGERGHGSRAEREKCRTKWKKMKEEFAHAKRSREGDSRYKEAPGIQPFFDRMEEFINGNFDNISPHSTIVRRTSSMSSGRPSSGGSGAASRGAGGSGSGSSSIGGSSSNGSGGSAGVGVVMRSSARIAANTTSGTLTNTSTSSNNAIDNQNTSSTINLNKSNTDYPCSTIESQSGSSPRQNHPRIPSSSNSNSTPNNNSNSSGGINPAPSTSAASSTTVATNTTSQDQQHNHQLTPCPQPQSIFKGDMCIYSTATPYNNNNSAGQNTPSANNNSLATSNLSSYANHHNDLNHHAPGSHEHADISYRVSSGCRQITIFGDHDVDIKFRGDCITINKIDIDYSSAETG